MADPVGEDAWLGLVDEASRTAGDLEQRVGVVELYKQAIAAEPWSNKLWLAYCEWVWSLYTDCQNGDAGWPEGDQLLGQELFSLETALDVWQQGASAIQFRLNDSHELWNRWISIELDLFSRKPDQDGIGRIRRLFFERLQIPHATWAETSQMFSTFITKYDEASWESTMVDITKMATSAKELYGYREAHELKLQRAVDSNDIDLVKSEMKDYLEWEGEQVGRRAKKGGPPIQPLILCAALFERALASTSLGLDSAIWEDYIVFLSSTKSDDPQGHLPPVLSVIQRATTHCPWSGALWARYILCAEAEHLPFETMERIKHAATDNRDLDRDGMGGVVDFYIAWCGYLKRRAMVVGATDEDIDVAEMGLPTAHESVHEWGQRRHGAEWKGDPLFRIERIFIQYLTQKGSVEEARGYWRRLVSTHADSYEFWQQYYLWEMTVRDPTAPPTLATKVLQQATRRLTLDWPEKMMEVFIRHCNNYEEVGTLLSSMGIVHKFSKLVAKRRQMEAAEAAKLYAQQQPTFTTEIGHETESPSGTKRKREAASEEADGGTKKKVKSAADQEALRELQLKRDRENTTIMVRNLAPDVTQTKVKHYFKEFGHINAIALKKDAEQLSSTAMIEFRLPEDVDSAIIRDGKFFGNRQMRVEAGTGLTLYVTNFPPTADDDYMHNLFADCGQIFSIRWPSLKYQTRRRFCYISFQTTTGAAAATQLHQKRLTGSDGTEYKLFAQYSDPGNKKNREGATAEGRELHITSLDPTLTEWDLKEVFGKYGKVEKARIVPTKSGESSGSAFVAYETKEQAEKALEMDRTKLKSSVLTVELSKEKNFNMKSTLMGQASSASPAPDADRDSIRSASPAPDAHYSSRAEVREREVALMNVPDTINGARIRALAEPFGDIVKVILRPDYQGAIIEYTEPASARKATLGLENYEIAPERRLRVGERKDLFVEKGASRTDRVQTGQSKKVPTTSMPLTAPIKRPGAGGKGGLGTKRGLGFSAVKTVEPTSSDGSSTGDVNGTANGVKSEGKKPKSNADFRSMLVSGGGGTQ